MFYGRLWIAALIVISLVVGIVIGASVMGQSERSRLPSSDQELVSGHDAARSDPQTASTPPAPVDARSSDVDSSLPMAAPHDDHPEPPIGHGSASGTSSTSVKKPVSTPPRAIDPIAKDPQGEVILNPFKKKQPK
jgi:hypothetical protein